MVHCNVKDCSFLVSVLLSHAPDQSRLGPHIVAHDGEMLQVWYCASRAPLQILNLPFVLLHGAQDGLSAPSLLS